MVCMIDCMHAGHVIPPLDGYQLACMRAFLGTFATAKSGEQVQATKSPAAGVLHEERSKCSVPVGSSLATVEPNSQAALTHSML